MKYTYPDGREAGFVLNQEGAGGMAHVGLYVKTDTGYFFFEVNGMDRNLKAGNKFQDYDNSVVLSNGPVSMPRPCSAASSGFATSAGASRRDFKSKGNYSAPKIPGIKQGFQQRQVLQLQRRLLHVFLLSPYKNGF
ncbi:MAG: hypothetical protein KIG77_04755 [Treponema sp.]|uniref:hypothetical protein n=1 Tax=Treponema sp. TaxID=166 RepID=UPI001D5D197C|nr:hypothetical protein [Treponema sp.]MBS7241679.1 hypothetical protein [Treponema sp.]